MTALKRSRGMAGRNDRLRTAPDPGGYVAGKHAATERPRVSRIATVALNATSPVEATVAAEFGILNWPLFGALIWPP